MSRLRRYSLKLPLRWKLALGSALLLFLLFAVYNLVQYAFVENWMQQQAEQAAQRDMRKLLNDLLENERSFSPQELPEIRAKLEKINERGQMIRVLDLLGQPIVAVEDGLPDDWERYYPVIPPAATGTWFLDGQLLLLRSPLTIFSFEGTVEVLKSVEEFDKLSAAFFQVMLLCCLGAMAISGLGGWLLSGQLLKPLKTMNEAMLKVKERGVQERVPLQGSGSDEMGALMQRFNEMMDQVERSFAQQQHFVEDASHELRTPVAIIEGQLRMLQRWGKHEPAIVDEALEASVQELARLKGLVEELLALSRAENSLSAQTQHARCLDAPAVMQRAAAKLGALQPQFELQVASAALDGQCLRVAEHHLEQLLLILLDNAVKYSGASRRIELTAALDGPQAVLAVADYGIGIAEGELPLVMNRFYRADKARMREGGGYGLGLAIARRLTENYGGQLRIHSSVGQGTTVELVLWLVPET